MSLWGDGSPFIVAEISCNHAGSEDLAGDLVVAAAGAGADAVKFQLFDPERMGDGHRTLVDGPWAGRTLLELYRAAETPRSWLPGLYQTARDLGMIPFCSVFDVESVDFLESLGTELYKIASPEVECEELVARLVATGRPILASDGVAGHRTRELLAGARELVVLRCVSEYPAASGDYGFNDVRCVEGGLWGLSDHSMDVDVWVTACALGASVIEAHLMLPRLSYGDLWPPLDVLHSLTPTEFGDAVARVRKVAQIAFNGPSESKAMVRLRWRWAVDKPGGVLVEGTDLVSVRSAFGVSKTDLDVAALGSLHTSRKVMAGHPVLLEDLYEVS